MSLTYVNWDSQNVCWLKVAYKLHHYYAHQYSGTADAEDFQPALPWKENSHSS